MHALICLDKNVQFIIEKISKMPNMPAAILSAENGNRKVRVPEKFDFNQKGWIKTIYESCSDFNLRRFSHFDLKILGFLIFVSSCLLNQRRNASLIRLD
jgi:hypothetical protein